MACTCSFCGKSTNEVAVMIAGPGGIFICDQCVELCGTILLEHMRQARVVEIRTAAAAGPAANAPDKTVVNPLQFGGAE